MARIGVVVDRLHWLGVHGLHRGLRLLEWLHFEDRLHVLRLRLGRLQGLALLLERDRRFCGGRLAALGVGEAVLRVLQALQLLNVLVERLLDRLPLEERLDVPELRVDLVGDLGMDRLHGWLHLLLYRVHCLRLNALVEILDGLRLHDLHRLVRLDRLHGLRLHRLMLDGLLDRLLDRLRLHGLDLRLDRLQGLQGLRLNGLLLDRLDRLGLHGLLLDGLHGLLLDRLHGLRVHLLVDGGLKDQAAVQAEDALQEELGLQVLVQGGVVLQDEPAVLAHGEFEAAAALHHEPVVDRKVGREERAERDAGRGRGLRRVVRDQLAALEVLVQDLGEIRVFLRVLTGRL